MGSAMQQVLALSCHNQLCLASELVCWSVFGWHQDSFLTANHQQN